MAEDQEHKFLQRLKATSQHVGLYLNGRKDGFGMVNYFEPRLLLQIGYFTNNLLHGLGMQIAGNDDKASSYLGTFDYGVPNKFGQIAKHNGVYKGHISEGVPHGIGCFLDNKGFERIGTFIDGAMNGYAEITEENSTYRYFGLVSDDMPHGSGTESTGTGIFKGYFCFGKRHGVGELNQGNLIYRGTWKDGVKTGYGYETLKDRYAYFGSFINGVKTGICDITYPDGTNYIGQIKTCRKEGFGKQVLNDEIYIGYWKHDRRHGIGFYKNTKGQTFFGQWREDQYKPQRGVELTGTKKSYSKIDHDLSSRLSPKPSEISYLVDDDEATPEFFEESTKRIIEIDEKITGEKIKIDQLYSNLDTNFSTDKRIVDTAKKEIELRCGNAEKEFKYMLETFEVACQKYGIDIFDAKQKLEKYPISCPTEKNSENERTAPVFSLQPKKKLSSKYKKQDNSQLSDFKPAQVSDVVNFSPVEADYFTLDKRDKSEAGVFESLLQQRKDSSNDKPSPKHNDTHQINSSFKHEDSINEIKGLILKDLTNKDANSRYDGKSDIRQNEVASNNSRLSKPTAANSVSKNNTPFSKMIQTFDLPPPLTRPQASVSVMSRVQESMKSDYSELNEDSRSMSRSQLSSLQSRRLERQLAKTSQDSSAKGTESTFDRLSTKRREIDSRISAIDHTLNFGNK